MKVYFSAAITYRDDYLSEYKAIKKAISDLGHTYLESFDVLQTSLETALEPDEDKKIPYYKKWLATISKADVAVIETSFPSTVHIGIEIVSLLERGKPTIVLYTKNNNPSFASEYFHSRMIKSEYSVTDVKQTLKWCFEEAEKMVNRRFTFFITPEIDKFLDKITKTKGLSRSEFIRVLLEEKINKSS